MTTQSTAKSKENVSNGASRDSWPQLSDKVDKVDKKILDSKQQSEKEKPKGKSKAKNGTDVQKRPEKKTADASGQNSAKSEGPNTLINGKSTEAKPIIAQNSTEKYTQISAKSK